MSVFSSETIKGDSWVIEVDHNEMPDGMKHYTYRVSVTLGVSVYSGAEGCGETKDDAIADTMSDLQEQLECAEHAVEIIKSALAALTARKGARSSSSEPSQ